MCYRKACVWKMKLCKYITQCDNVCSLFGESMVAGIKQMKSPTLLLLRTSSRCHRLSATFTLPGNCSTTVPEPWLIFKVGVPSISSRWRKGREGELVWNIWEIRFEHFQRLLTSSSWCWSRNNTETTVTHHDKEVVDKVFWIKDSTLTVWWTNEPLSVY